MDLNAYQKDSIPNGTCNKSCKLHVMNDLDWCYWCFGNESRKYIWEVFTTLKTFKPLFMVSLEFDLKGIL